jgi:gliding motility-associated-like protein
MSKRVIVSLIALLSFCSPRLWASHLIGGEMTYVYIKDSTGGVIPVVYHIYQITLNIYEDCLNGNPDAIAQDNPAYFGVYTGTGSLVAADSAFFSTSITVPVNFQNSCVKQIPQTCMFKKTFNLRIALPHNSSGYIIDYQRCCRNVDIDNVLPPADNNGSTYYCTIPGSYTNNSAVFKNFPAQIICDNNPLVYDNSATDVDGDSLSYGFCAALNGADPADVKPFPPFPPPFDSVTYLAPTYSSQTPLTGFPRLQIDPHTGIITGTPNLVGRYLVTVFCNEYRDGLLINTIKREFQYVVTSCTKVVVADIPQYSSDFNTYEVDCQNYTVNFVNTSTGGFDYHWDFGVAGTDADTSNQFEPTFTYPDTGTYTVSLVVNPHSTCPDSISRYVKVYPKFIAAFADSGMQCPGATQFFKDQSTATIKPIVSWQWSFGDGDSSTTENPQHHYTLGGTYNVTLISSNIKNCIDTAVRQIVIDNFHPFAGNDTFIVKGERIQFDATGGTQYAWTPPTNLSDTSIYDPVGYYPDTGTYTYFIHVTSPYGCSGYDTIKVYVVNQASFFVPTAFAPGSGHNDIFKPLAVGYKSLDYFRIFNRWGQEVFYTRSFETGWDGTYNNHKADVGTYFWEMGYTDRYGTKTTLKGDVTLLR